MVMVIIVSVLLFGANGCGYLNTSGQEEAPGQEEVPALLVGAGDIASCTSTGDEATAILLDRIDGTVFTMGDNAYDAGTDAEFEECYEPRWGRHKARTYPSPGNHEYYTAYASGFFNYFGAAARDPGRGYYGYDLGEWHLVALNSMCENVGGCEEDSPMIRWLKEDLAANSKTCTLAYWHHPLFSSGYHGSQAKMQPTWVALYAADVELVVNGHDHDYERFVPQDPNGVPDPEQGIREFVVGTGGINLTPFETMEPNSEFRDASTHGVLKLTLRSSSYDWEFVSVPDETTMDSGSGNCD